MESRQEFARLCEEERLIIFIGCGKSKRSGRHNPLSLYIGNYFGLCLSLARSLVPDDRIFVMSAKYGVLSHEEEVEKYDLKLSDLSTEDRKCWRSKVKAFVLEQIENGLKPVFICGKLYHEGLPGKKLLPPLGMGLQMRFIRNLLRKEKGFGL